MQAGSDKITGNTQGSNTQCIDPVIEPNRQFPYMHFTQWDSSASHGLVGFNIMNSSSVFIIHMHCTCQAWIERVDGPAALQEAVSDQQQVFRSVILHRLTVFLPDRAAKHSR